MPLRYVAPKFRETAFTCPHCTAFAQHDWGYVGFEGVDNQEIMWTVTRCIACDRVALWDGTGHEILSANPANEVRRQQWVMVYPSGVPTAPDPNEDLLTADVTVTRTLTWTQTWTPNPNPSTHGRTVSGLPLSHPSGAPGVPRRSRR